MTKFDKLLEKKKGEGKELSDTEKAAKGSVLKHLGDMASEAMGDHMGDHLKKVTVAADSKEGLKHGLDKAKDIVSKAEEAGMLGDAEGGEHDDESSEEESPEHEAAESPEFEAGEQEEAGEESAEDEDEYKSPEDVDAKIQELLKLKAQLEKQHS